LYNLNLNYPYSMWIVVIKIKNMTKRISGRHYEKWIRNPYLVFRKLNKRIMNVLISIKRPAYGKRHHNALREGKKYFKLPLSKHYEPWVKKQYARIQSRRFVATSGRLLQRWAIVCMHKPFWHPLRLIVYPLLAAIIYIVELYYRSFYLHYGDAVATLIPTQVKRTKLLLVSGTLGSGGSERQTVLTVMGLARHAVPSVRLAVVQMRSQAERFYLHNLEAAGMKVIEFNRDSSRDHTDGLCELLKAVKLLPHMLHDVAAYTRTLVEQRPQIVHLWLDEVNIKGGLAAVAAGIPQIILSGRNLPPNNFLLYQPYMREGYRWLLKQPGVTLINNSAAGARAYERWLGLRKGSIRVVHNGFDFEDALLTRCHQQRAAYRERHGIPPMAPVVGTVIRFNEEKRPLLWAEIAARIGRAIPEAHFLMVGDGPLRENLQERAALPDLAGRLHAVGLEKQALEAMAAMDLFLLSSRGEGLPNVLVEAQALGVPVVTTCAGGAPETLEHKRTGWVLSSDNPDIAAAEIVDLLQNPSWLRAAALAAPKFVKCHFGLERMLDETLEVYGDNSRPMPNDGGNDLPERKVS
jgi:glycosyltransferase involved in cell wall biosynthesis